MGRKLSADLTNVKALTDWQLATDRARTKQFPDLFKHKLQRMSASPLAFLRGAAPLFYEMLGHRRELEKGPDGSGWIAGDLHLENFGAYQPEDVGLSGGKQTKHPAVFDLNDFDDTVIGPWRYDVLRLMTSFILAGRELGANGLVSLELVDHLASAWDRAVFDGESPGTPPPPVAALIEQVRARSQRKLISGRTTGTKGKRIFVRGARYADLDRKILKKVPVAVREYISTVTQTGNFKIEDAALRIAGTGSLGGLRIAVLVEGKGDSEWIFDLKEQGVPSAASLLGKPKIEPAQRVVTGFRACVRNPPRMMGTSHIETKTGMLELSGRRLSPQEDKLNLKKLRGAELPQLASYLGALVGSAHARGATKRPKRRWTKSDFDLLRANAITLAGIHEAVYIALCDRMRAILQ